MKDFDAAVAEAADEPIIFRAGGRTFTAKRGAAGPLLRMARIAAEGEDLPLDRALAIFDEFISSLVIEKAEWKVALDELDITMVVEIAHWLVEEMTGRPTSPRSPSDESRSNTGQPSNGVSPQPVVATSW